MIDISKLKVTLALGPRKNGELEDMLLVFPLESDNNWETDGAAIAAQWLYGLWTQELASAIIAVFDSEEKELLIPRAESFLVQLARLGNVRAIGENGPARALAVVAYVTTALAAREKAETMKIAGACCQHGSGGG